jgi:hypothetical protein
LCLDGIGAGSQELYVELVKLLFCVTKLGRFDRSTGSVSFGIEIEQDAFTAEVSERDVLAVIGFQREFRGLVTGL